MNAAPALVVVYERGAANVTEIARSLARLAPLVFVTREDSGHTRPLLPLLRDLGRVFTYRGTPDEVAGGLSTAGVGGIVTFSETMLAVTAELAEGLGLAHHSRETARLLTDKCLQRQRLNATGTGPVAASLLTRPEDWPDAVHRVGLPAIVKPVHGEGSRNTFRVDDPDEGQVLVRRLLDSESALAVEHLLRGRPCAPYGDYVSVESVTCGGTTTHLAVTGKFPLLPPFRETGQFWPAALPAEEYRGVLELAGEAVTALGVTTGITHTEIKLTRAGPRVIEVNGRLGGNVNELSLRAAGLDLVELAGRVALGHPVDIAPVRHDRVVFQYSNPVPPRPCRLLGVRGQRELRRTPGVTGYRAWIRPGASADGGVSTQDLDLITGEAADHAGMLDVVAGALGHLAFTFSFDPAEDPVEITARDLPASGAEPE
ncbi:hypothetical protein [Streptomyces sp. NPDC089799]|uniref:ATP-grasp domain-containing protein n=1 Tax=Streptomyces sp. NPDC089799 TaxID=3155066 RepID=UPI0034437B56